MELTSAVRSVSYKSDMNKCNGNAAKSNDSDNQTSRGIKVYLHIIYYQLSSKMLMFCMVFGLSIELYFILIDSRVRIFFALRVIRTQMVLEVETMVMMKRNSQEAMVQLKSL